MENIFTKLGDTDLDKVIASYSIDYVDMEFNLRKFRQRIYELACDEKKKRERSTKCCKTFMESVVAYWDENFVYIEPNEFEDNNLPRAYDDFIQKLWDDLAFCVWTVTELSQWGMDNCCDTIEVQPWWDEHGHYNVENGLTLVRFYDGDFLIDVNTTDADNVSDYDIKNPKVYQCIVREEEETMYVFNKGELIM